jgi:hypothetical protein
VNHANGYFEVIKATFREKKNFIKMHLNIIFGSKNQFVILDVNQNKTLVFLQTTVYSLSSSTVYSFSPRPIRS